MQIRLSEYQENVAVPVEEVLDPKDLDVEFVDLEYKTPLQLKGTIEKGADVLIFRGRLSSDVQRVCGRCTKPVQSHLDLPFDLTYEIKGLEVVETLDDLREVLILDHPMQFVCRKDCRGLCPQCGADRNETTCRCPKPAPRSAFSALQKLRNKKENKKNA